MSTDLSHLFKLDESEFIDEPPPPITDDSNKMPTVLSHLFARLDESEFTDEPPLLIDDESSDEDDEENEEREYYEPQRSLFEILESDFVYDDEVKSDPVFASIHASVQLSLNSLGIQHESPLKVVQRRGPSSAKQKQSQSSVQSKEPTTHRNADLMKEFAINLNPHTFMVCISLH